MKDIINDIKTKEQRISIKPKEVSQRKFLKVTNLCKYCSRKKGINKEYQKGKWVHNIEIRSNMIMICQELKT